MALRPPLLLSKLCAPSLLNQPLTALHPAHRNQYALRLASSISNHKSPKRPFSSSRLRQNYTHFSNPNPYLPPPPAPKPSRSTTFFRLINSLSGLAAIYLLFCAVQELQLMSDALAQIETNHSLDQLERQLERVRAEESAAPRDREFERRLLRWRGLAREGMMARDDGGGWDE